MPYSFTEIEQTKNRTIGFVFGFLIVFYFLTIYIITLIVKNFVFLQSMSNTKDYSFSGFTVSEFLSILILSGFVGYLHWLCSVHNLIPKILRIINAQPLNEQDDYHQMLKNIVDEVVIATGGKSIEAVVVPTSAMNAFALADFQGKAVIGVTEGLLARLNRAQIEAVVGHEAAHIISGDCLATTFTSSLFALYTSILSGVSCLLQGRRGYSSRGNGGGIAILVFIYIILSVTRLMSLLANMFISRQREFKADAISVRLTRDPLSLAEALYTIAYHWRGSGLSGEEFEAIFIVNPNFSQLDEQSTLWSDLFSTHPPVDQRLKILLDMTHTDVQVLEDSFQKNRAKRKQELPDIHTATLLQPQQTIDSPNTSRGWLVYNQAKWEGPFSLSQLGSFSGLHPESWVKRSGGEVCLAYEDSILHQMLIDQIDKKTLSTNSLSCPRCRVPLSTLSYEGANINTCSHCFGVLVEENDVQRIIIREKISFPDRIYRIVETIQRNQKHFAQQKINMKAAALYSCPRCSDPKPKMLKMFYTLAYPVEIDKCHLCGYIWFEKDELEILQCLIEDTNRDKYQ